MAYKRARSLCQHIFPARLPRLLLSNCWWNVSVRRNRVPPAAGGEFHGASEAAGSSGGRIQPLGLGGELFEAKVSFHPLGVSCQMSLLG